MLREDEMSATVRLNVHVVTDPRAIHRNDRTELVNARSYPRSSRTYAEAETVDDLMICGMQGGEVEKSLC
ncbi:hypothetical protein GCM10011591_02500 [Nocardia camponoti]|uniref:Uncharacterized protein n=1 Tax=Nocardia camponoti TaxID=1616106 RepID=A0A917Q7X9_9NOCA|nr:hypothetical protein GCM10011591_02500 [Nocardia camponoti]